MSGLKLTLIVTVILGVITFPNEVNGVAKCYHCNTCNPADNLGEIKLCTYWNGTDAAGPHVYCTKGVDESWGVFRGCYAFSQWDLDNNPYDEAENQRLHRRGCRTGSSRACLCDEDECNGTGGLHGWNFIKFVVCVIITVFSNFFLFEFGAR